jgi:hypothetical protein
MQTRRYQLRDVEILRTLGRLRYVRTADLTKAFFSSDPVCRRRLRHLKGLGLIQLHSKGVPTHLPVRAWRLSPEGVRVLSQLCPDEKLPDGLVERLAAGRLYHLDHREALTRIYLDLISGREEAVDEADPGAVQERALRMRRRAEQLGWSPDGDTILRVSVRGEERQVIPDVLVAAPGLRRRLFVELDRSTNNQKRIESALARYTAFFGRLYTTTYPDQFAPSLLFVVRSKARQEGIVRTAKKVLGASIPWHVRVDEDAAPWLAEWLLTPEPARPTPPVEASPEPTGSEDLRRAAREVFNVTMDLLAERERRTGERASAPAAEALKSLHRLLTTHDARGAV